MGRSYVAVRARIEKDDEGKLLVRFEDPWTAALAGLVAYALQRAGFAVEGWQDKGEAGR